MERSGPGLYVWFDTEFTSLDLEKAWLLQVAALITDSGLKRVLPPEKDLSLNIRLAPGMEVSEWVEENLPDLLKKCRSPQAVEISEADRLLAAYVDEAAGPPAEAENSRPVLAGNSVHMDWMIARRFLPLFSERLHYRHLDVTSFKLEWQRLHPGTDLEKDEKKFILRHFPGAVLPAEEARHSAYFDIQASIAELSFYRKNLLRK